MCLLVGRGRGTVYIVLNHCQEYINNTFINVFTYLEEITNIIPHRKPGNPQNPTENEMYLLVHSFI